MYPKWARRVEQVFRKILLFIGVISQFHLVITGHTLPTIYGFTHYEIASVVSLPRNDIRAQSPQKRDIIIYVLNNNTFSFIG